MLKPCIILHPSLYIFYKHLINETANRWNGSVVGVRFNKVLLYIHFLKTWLLIYCLYFAYTALLIYFICVTRFMCQNTFYCPNSHFVKELKCENDGMNKLAPIILFSWFQKYFCFKNILLYIHLKSKFYKLTLSWHGALIFIENKKYNTFFRSTRNSKIHETHRIYLMYAIQLN